MVKLVANPSDNTEKVPKKYKYYVSKKTGQEETEKLKKILRSKTIRQLADKDPEMNDVERELGDITGSLSYYEIKLRGITNPDAFSKNKIQELEERKISLIQKRDQLKQKYSNQFDDQYNEGHYDELIKLAKSKSSSKNTIEKEQRKKMLEVSKIIWVLLELLRI